MDQLLPVYFERLLESSLDIVIAVDREGQIIFYNDGAYKTLGYTSAEILGKQVTTVYPSLDEARAVKAAMRSGEFGGERGKVRTLKLCWSPRAESGFRQRSQARSSTMRPARKSARSAFSRTYVISAAAISWPRWASLPLAWRTGSTTRSR